MKFKRIIPFFCCLAIAGGMLAGCGGKENETTDKSSAVSEETSEEEAEETSVASEETSEAAKETASESSSEESSDKDNANNIQYGSADFASELQTDFLAKTIEMMSKGGKSGDGYNYDDITPASVDLLSLKGTWCKEGSVAENPDQATTVMTDANFDLGEDEISQFTVLPDTMVIGLGDDYYLADSIKDVQLIAGCRLADFTYRDNTGDSFYAILPLKISDTTLGVGFYQGEDNDSASLLQEMDYKINFTGYRLTLSYGDESVTYVPVSTISGTDEPNFLGGGEIVSGYQPIKNMTGIYPGAETPQVTFNGTTAVRASFHFFDDGRLLIELEDGELISVNYRYSGDTITLIDGNNIALYAQ